MKSLVCANKISSTNILYFVWFLLVDPLWIESLLACVNVEGIDGSSENCTLSMIWLYFGSKSRLVDKCWARWTLALAIGSKLGGLVIAQNVPPKGINRNCEITKEKADATSG